MMFRYKKIFKFSLFILINLIGSFLLGMLINSSVENVKITVMIEQFKDKGIYQESMSNSYNKYYKVSRETWMSDEDSFVIKNGRMTYGNEGDIILGLDSNAGSMSLTNDIVSFFFGGHAASVCFEEEYNNVSYYNNYCIESHLEQGVHKEISSYWNDEYYRNQVMCVRVKASKDEKRKAFHKIADCIGKKYNKLYLLDTKNKYYCTDLISRAWQSIGYDLNYDGLYCSVGDIICSDLTYITFYKEYRNNIAYYYYVG